MKCSECGYDNTDDALCCNLCSIVLRREVKSAPPPAAAPPPSVGFSDFVTGPTTPPASAGGSMTPAEPADLSTPESVAALAALALTRVEENRTDEAIRLMSRLYLELPLPSVHALYAGTIELWSKNSPVHPGEKAAMRVVIDMSAKAVLSGSFREAFEIATTTLPILGRDSSPAGAQLMLFLLGLKGASLKKPSSSQ